MYWLNGVSIIKQCNISKGMATCLIKRGAPLSFHLLLICNDFMHIFWHCKVYFFFLTLNPFGEEGGGLFWLSSAENVNLNVGTYDTDNTIMSQLNKPLRLSGIPSLFKPKFDGHVITVIPIPHVCIFRNVTLRNIICLLMPFYKDFLIVFIIKICFSSNFTINPRCLYTIMYIWRI